MSFVPINVPGHYLGLLCRPPVKALDFCSMNKNVRLLCNYLVVRDCVSRHSHDGCGSRGRDDDRRRDSPAQHQSGADCALNVRLVRRVRGDVLGREKIRYSSRHLVALCNGQGLPTSDVSGAGAKVKGVGVLHVRGREGLQLLSRIGECRSDHAVHKRSASVAILKGRVSNLLYKRELRSVAAAKEKSHFVFLCLFTYLPDIFKPLSFLFSYS
jgi:hypothetical protein